MLDDLGLVPAIEALIDRRREAGLEITGELALGDMAPRNGGLGPQLETTIYRLVQESLTNVIKHAHASKVRVSVATIDGEVRIEVQDNGVGLDPGGRSDGFGLAGMRERVYLAGGTIELESGGSGTLVRARLPQQTGCGKPAVGVRAAADYPPLGSG
jgi:signal transduction histidine kinase